MWSFIGFFFILLFVVLAVYILAVKAFYWGGRKGPPDKGNTE